MLLLGAGAEGDEIMYLFLVSQLDANVSTYFKIDSLLINYTLTVEHLCYFFVQEVDTKIPLRN